MADKLDISDVIWKEVGRYLPVTDKAAASRVNKAWSKAFRPQMYRSLDLKKGGNNRDDDKSLERNGDEDEDEDEGEGEDSADGPPSKVLMPPKEVVYKYEGYITDLKLNFPSPYLEGRTTWATKSLKSLYLDALGPAKETAETLATLDQLLVNSPALTLVELRGFKLDGLMFVLQRIQHVEIVNFSMCDFTGIEDAFKKAKLDLRAKKIAVDMNRGIDFQGMINWIGHFRHLDGLMLNHPSDDMDDEAIIFPEKAPKINMSALRKITGLVTLNVGGPMLWGNQMEQMLKNCPKVTNLSFFNQTFHEIGFWAMFELFPNLTNLSLVGCDRFRPWMVKMVLDYCPRLVSLSCPQFDLEYVFNPKVQIYQSTKVPRRGANQLWPCTGLKTLILDEISWTSNAKHVKLFMKHIGSLKNLENFQLAYIDREEEELRVVVPGAVRTAGKDLKVTLEEGNFTRKELEEDASMKWVLDVWPKMKMFSIMP